MEPRKIDNEAAKELRQYLSSLKVRIDKTVFQDLMRLAHTCYLLTADGDFTPVATAVRSLGKKVYAASPNQGAQLAAAVDTFIPLSKAWFADCW